MAEDRQLSLSAGNPNCTKESDLNLDVSRMQRRFSGHFDFNTLMDLLPSNKSGSTALPPAGSVYECVRSSEMFGAL